MPLSLRMTLAVDARPHPAGRGMWRAECELDDKVVSADGPGSIRAIADCLREVAQVLVATEVAEVDVP